MKKIVFGFTLLLILLGTVQAKSYPEVLNDGQSFTNIKNFRGIFKKIYNDTNEVDLTKICERTLQWPDLWDKEKLNYSVLNCQNLNSRENLSNFLNLAKNSFLNFNDFKNKFIYRFNLEMDLLQLENDLKRKTSLNYIFADGRNKSNNSAKDTTSDSPFDLVSDLNEIDEIIFGEKSQRPMFKFTEKKSREISAEIPTEDSNKDNWLIQTAENLPNFSEKFNNYKNNLSGGLWRSGIKIFREKLNNHALWLKYVGKEMLDSFATNGTFTNPGFDANLSEKPSKSEDKPEAIKLAYNPLKELDAYINKYVLEESLYKTEENQGFINRSTYLENIAKKNKIQKKIIKNQLESFQQKISRDSDNFSSNRSVLNFQKFNSYLDLIREKLKFLRTEIFPDFLSKPQHSS